MTKSAENIHTEESASTYANPWLASLLTLFTLGGGITYATNQVLSGLAALGQVIAALLFLGLLFALTEMIFFLYLFWGIFVGLIFYFMRRAFLLAKVQTLRRWVLAKVLLVTAVHFIAYKLHGEITRYWTFEVNKVAATSMSPNLNIGDYFTVNKLSFGIWNPFTNKSWQLRPPQRGDLITFILPQDPSKHYVKRVIGLPGDQIEIKDKRLNINGVEAEYTMVRRHTLQNDSRHIFTQLKGEQVHESFFGLQYTIFLADQSYGQASWRSDVDAPRSNRPWGPKVSPDHVFVLGDNRDNSLDSRHWGLIPMNQITGHVTHRIFSIDPAGHIRWDQIINKIQ